MNPGRLATRLAGPLALSAVLVVSPAWVAASEPLPEPLSLDQALTLAEAPHPDLATAHAALEAAEARRLGAGAVNDFEANLSLDARWVEPPDIATYPDEHNDSRALLTLRKELYDFGRSKGGIEAAEAGVRASEWLLREAEARRHMDIMRRFLDVILADITFERETERMATAYVAMDRARDRNELGQVSDIDLLQLEDEYQATRMSRQAALTNQRATRSLLAQALGRPASLPARLLPPMLPGNDAELPDYETLLAVALRGNPRLLAAREALDDNRQQMAASRAQRYPSLRSEITAGAYEQEFGSRQPFVASLVLDVPLYTGDRVDAAVAGARAGFNRAQADLERTEYWVRQQLLETWQAIQTLKAQREQVLVRQDYRELYLDRSRAQYELEIKTDLGDAMVQQSDARLLAHRTEYELALAWERLAWLTGEPSLSPLLPPGEKAPLTADEANP
ncbi:MAG TPA: transporter [Thioalkalivibrio sp.]|nr:transporter [Thioalkalivibrio sp.]